MAAIYYFKAVTKSISFFFFLQQKMKEKVDMILKHNITCFINRYVKMSFM